ncbi:membrane protein [Chitinimonas prasina]|uniref:Protoporphyrinogen IX oxidase n=1 Tax=Chitinimonas prasina TaxID=1434937 RepID=A0ABQ5YE77_9NEIS|nr:CopD family protein [Chitinimonas prasina]GLR12303.1 membrane protein [Chitinimonas prasina]
MLWVKALHIIFVISWMAGLLYLPRLFVNHAMATDPATQAQLALMERKLFRFTTLLGVLALVFGLWLLRPWMAAGWMHAKLTLVMGLIGFHVYCGKLVRDFAAGRNQRSHRWYRLFNEIPTLIMMAIVILVVVKPF